MTQDQQYQDMQAAAVQRIGTRAGLTLRLGQLLAEMLIKALEKKPDEDEDDLGADGSV